MDLASFFAEGAEALQAARSEALPAFPVPGLYSGNGQTIGPKRISRISRISRCQEGHHGLAGSKNLQAGAGGRASERARVTYAGPREIREQREMPASSGASISRSSLHKREMEGKSGNVVSLPGADGLTQWRAGLAQLNPGILPCPGYRADEWPRTLARACTFLDTFGAQAEALGWTATRLFGVHAEAGIVRVDTCGALVLPIGGAVRAITATEISFGHLTHREKPSQTKGVPLWRVGRTAA